MSTLTLISCQKNLVENSAMEMSWPRWNDHFCCSIYVFNWCFYQITLLIILGLTCVKKHVDDDDDNDDDDDDDETMMMVISADFIYALFEILLSVN